MSQTIPFASLADALDTELALLVRLREMTTAASVPLIELDVAAVEDWARDQAALMAEIDAAASVRADLQESCLPPRARGIAGGGGLASTVTLHVLIARAPRTQAARLRQQRDTIRQLRDEIAAAILHNEVLIGQVLEFTDHLGHGLVDATRSEGYDKSGQQADHLASGELFSGAI